MTTTSDTTARTAPGQPGPGQPGPGQPGPGQPGPRGRAPGKYQRVADALRDQILSGELAPTAPIPSVIELERVFGVSRTTARAAVELLRAEGLVVVYNGRGAFVRSAATRPTRTHPRTIGRTARGYRDDSEQWHQVDDPDAPDVGGTFRTDATPELALALSVPEHTPIFIYERLLAGPQGQRMIHRLYLPFTTAADIPALTRDPFRTPTELYKILEKARHVLAWTETVRARMPTPSDTTALHLPEITPLLIARRTTTDTHTGRPLALEETRLSAEDTQLLYTLTPTTPA
jgi:GntR family transcriptional regulator